MRSAMAEARGPAIAPTDGSARRPSQVTDDAFLGGRLRLVQPQKGHRSGTDAVLLAAAAPRDASGLVYDVGAGVGAAGLGLALACPQARVRLVERDIGLAALAEANVAANGLDARVSVAVCDILDRDLRRQVLGEPADLIVTNPPFYRADAVRASPEPDRQSAHVLEHGVSVADWVLACLDLLAVKGTLIVVHAATALPELLAAFNRRLGATTILAVHPRAGEPARRVLVRGVKGSRAPLTIAAPLVLHEGQSFGVQAARLHKGEARLDW